VVTKQNEAKQRHYTTKKPPNTHTPNTKPPKTTSNMVSLSLSSSSVHLLSPSPFHVAQTSATATAAQTTPTTGTTFSKAKWFLVALVGLTWLNLGGSSRQLQVHPLPTTTTATTTNTNTTSSGWVGEGEKDTRPRRSTNTTNSTTTTRTTSSTSTNTTSTTWTSVPQQASPLQPHPSSSPGRLPAGGGGGGGLWVIVPYYTEGISGWMLSLAELLVFCKTYNATFVMPHIENGRLNTTMTSTGLMPVLDLFDSTLIYEYHSDLVTVDDYHTAVSTSTTTSHNKNNDVVVKLFSICMTWWHGGCSDDEIAQRVPTGSHGPHEGQGRYSTTLEAALQWTQTNPNDMVVLELNRYTRQALSRKHVRQYPNNNKKKKRTTTRKLISDDEVTRVMQSVFQFHPNYHALATVALQHLGIREHQPYLTFHWRAEKEGLDYMHCAHALVESKNHVVSQYNIHNKGGATTTNKNKNTTSSDDNHNHFHHHNNSTTTTMPVILLSSLNTNADLEWGGAKDLANNTSAPQALAYLLQPVQQGGGGFLKLDSVLSQVLLQLQTTQQQQQQQQFPSPPTTPTSTTAPTTTSHNNSHFPPSPPPDMIVTVVLDLILALRSHQFVTCTRACSDSFCQDCNVLTKFGNFTLTLRQQQKEARRQDLLQQQQQQQGTRRRLSNSSPTITTVDYGNASNLASVWVDPIQHQHYQDDYQCWPVPATRTEEKGTDTSTTSTQNTTFHQNQSAAQYP
jgi:hypothetical protein